MRISYVGHQPELLHNVLVTSGKDLILDIYLGKIVTQVSEVEIKANLRNDRPVENLPSTLSTIDSGALFHFNRRDSLVNEGTGINRGIELTFKRQLEKGYYFLMTGSIFSRRMTK